MPALQPVHFAFRARIRFMRWMRACGPSIAFDARLLVLMQLQDKMPLLNGEIAAEEFFLMATQLACPTLVLHAHGDTRAPFEEGLRIAGIIPGARFVPLNSLNHVLLELRIFHRVWQPI